MAVSNLVISLVALHKGQSSRKSFLDGKEVPFISAYFERLRCGFSAGSQEETPTAFSKALLSLVTDSCFP